MNRVLLKPQTTDQSTNDPPTTYLPTYVKTEDQILNKFRILKL